MAFPQRLLGEGEEVVLHMRTHLKALVLPVLILLVVAAADGFALGVLPDNATGASTGRWIALAIGVAVVARWSGWPFLSWLSDTYTVTTERLITRQGVLSRYGRDIPLGRINDIAYDQDILDRILGCGSLNVSAASEHGTIVLRDVPKVHEVQLEMSELVRDARGWAEPQRRSSPELEQSRDQRTRPLRRDVLYDWPRDQPGER